MKTLVNKLDQYSGEKIIVSGSEEAGNYVIVDSNVNREGTNTLKINLKWGIELNMINQQFIESYKLLREGVKLIFAEIYRWVSLFF